MSKNILSGAFYLLVLALSFPVEAQQPKKIARIGLLESGISLSSGGDAFRKGLWDLGYKEGKNIKIESRQFEDRVDRLPAFAAELVRLKVDVIVAMGTPAAQAARDASKTVPIVIAIGGDPVTERLVPGLARPGGNITGVTTLISELSGKRFELLQEMIPDVSRIAVLFSRTGSGPEQLADIEDAARNRGVKLQAIEVRGPEDFEGAFSAMKRERSSALIVARTSLINAQSTLVIKLAAQNRLPAMYSAKIYVEAGGLVSYGSDLADSYRRAAIYVDKILKGSKPSDLPIEQPTKFELVINLKTAKLIGLTIPPTVLARADKVIR